LALELIDDAMALGLSIEVVLFDSRYCVHGMAQGLKKRKVGRISEIKPSQIAEFWVKEGGKTRKIAMSITNLFKAAESICKIVKSGLKLSGQDNPSQILYTTQEIVVSIKALNSPYARRVKIT